MASAHFTEVASIHAVVGSGTVNVVDEVALADEATMDRVRYLAGVCVYGGHALCVATEGWDGSLPVLAAPVGELTTMIKVMVDGPSDFEEDESDDEG